MKNKYNDVPEDTEEFYKFMDNFEEDMQQDDKECSVEILVIKLKEETLNIQAVQEIISEQEVNLKRHQKRLVEITAELNSRTDA